MEDIKALKDLKREDGIYQIPVTWQMYSTIDVEADNLEDALNRARKHMADLPLGDADYIDESYEIGSDEDAEQLFSETSKWPSRGVLLKRDGKIEKFPGDL